MQKHYPFIKADKVSLDLKKSLADANKKRVLQIGNEIYQPEYAIECDRRLVYRASSRSVTPLTNAISYEQQLHASYWESIFRDMPYVEVRDKNIPIHEWTYNISCRADLVIHITTAEEGEFDSLVMARHLDPSAWSDVCAHGPSRRDIVADMIRMWISEIPHCISIYALATDPTKFELYHVLPYTPIIKKAREKFRNLSLFKMNGKLPGRPYKDNKNAECQACEFSQQCWS